MGLLNIYNENGLCAHCVVFLKGIIMRVISGTARSLCLKTLPGDSTRPTTDKIKETLFNMIQYDISDAYFLDLFSGSGAIGIEALSRGANKAVFVEQNPKAVRIIKENLQFTRLADKAVIKNADVLSYLSFLSLTFEEKFDFVFMDPPYDRGLEKSALEYLSKSLCIDEDTIIIVEASIDTDFSYVNKLGFEVSRIKNYKTNKHVFLKKRTM